jgi:hypothetical protein
LLVKKKERKKRAATDGKEVAAQEGVRMQKREVLSHPALGKLPARKVLECIFALSPTGSILHHHLEEVSKTDLENDGVLYTLTGQPPSAGRERCRVIPPFVRQFGTVE